MDLYHKPTDTQRYLPFTSSHPNHCKRNIPLFLAWRICTIVENNVENLRNLENVKSNLSKYHYPDSLINHGFQKVNSIPQKDLRKLKEPSNESILLFISTFSPSKPNIYSTINPFVLSAPFLYPLKTENRKVNRLIVWKTITLAAFIIST